MTVFTTRPDTLFGATFFVVAADAKLADELVTEEQRPALAAYVEEVRKATDIERLATDRPKTGVFLGVHATNPVTGWQMPVYASDYVLADYGTGAIMAVPGQDQRDWEFAETFDLPIVRTVQPPADFEGEAYTGAGPAINSANDEISLDGMDVADAKSTIIEWLRRRAWAGAPSTSGCATGCCPVSATGEPRSRSSTATLAARWACRTTSCPWSCPSCMAPS